MLIPLVALLCQMMLLGAKVNWLWVDKSWWEDYISECVKANWLVAKDTDGILIDSLGQHQALDSVLWTDWVFSVGKEPHPRQ